MRVNPKPKLQRSLVVGLVAAVTAALVAAPATAQPEPEPTGGGPGGDWWDELRQRVFVERHLRAMSLEERIGQLFVTYVYGESADTTDPDDVAANRGAHGVDNAEQLLREYDLGGVIYFAWSNNVNDPGQIAALSNGLQQTAAETSGTPLLVSTDQEHGIVTRITAPATQLPGAMALGAAFDPDAAREAAAVSGTELRAMGVNQNFAPVADVNVAPENPVIGVRSFSSDPSHAADMVAAQVAGYQDDAGVTATIKHFPGHGDTSDDSHTSLPQIDHTYEEWQELDAPPFAAAIDQGVDTVMTGHLQFPDLDPSLTPATLSEPILTGLLRDELGFEGVVVTDSLRMEGVRAGYGDDEIPVMALQAGADLLLMPEHLDVAFAAVLEAVETGQLSRDRIDRSVTRILNLKYEQGLFEDALVDEDAVDDVVGIDEHLATAQDISDLSTTLVANDGTLPIGGGTGDALVTGWGASTTAAVADRIGEHGWHADALETGAAPTTETIEAAVSAAAGKDLVVVTTNGVTDDPAQAALVAALDATGAPVVTIAVRNPYDIAHYADHTAAHLATYSYGAEGVSSAVSVLFGAVEPQGRLPVDVPGADDPTRTLYEFGHGLGY